MAKNKKLESRVQTLEYINWELRSVGQAYSAMTCKALDLLEHADNLIERQNRMIERVMNGESAASPKP